MEYPIQVENVTFTYLEGEEPAITSIDLKVKKLTVPRPRESAGVPHGDG